MDKATEEVYNKLFELHEEQKRDKGEDKLTTEEAYTIVLGKRSGYTPGIGPGPNPLDRECTNGQRLRAQIRAEVEAEMTTRIQEMDERMTQREAQMDQREARMEQMEEQRDARMKQMEAQMMAFIERRELEDQMENS
ncbi:hypothetical protein KSP40_PGU003146 [Platanthera guangdongensis]|uniref:Uncharacterized protein n=1 Tax=Platanthera guangdongensis TaxID=2320717 RepID=A0ABR2N178_9ASPA